MLAENFYLTSIQIYIKAFYPDFKMQCLAKSATLLAVQSALDFSFIFAHHSSLPISGAHAESMNNNTANNDVEMFLLSRFIDDFPWSYL